MSDRGVIVEVDFRALAGAMVLGFEPVASLPCGSARAISHSRRYRILEAVCEEMAPGQDIDRLRRHGGPSYKTWALHLAQYLLRREGLSLEQIGLCTWRTASAAAAGITHINLELRRQGAPGLAKRLQAIMERANYPHRA